MKKKFRVIGHVFYDDCLKINVEVVNDKFSNCKNCVYNNDGCHNPIGVVMCSKYGIRYIKYKRSKQDSIEFYMLGGKPITQKIAIEKFSAYRLAVIIQRLKKKHHIETEMVQEGRVRYAKYHIV